MPIGGKRKGMEEPETENLFIIYYHFINFLNVFHVILFQSSYYY